MPPPMGGGRGMRYGGPIMSDEEKAAAPKITKELIFRALSYLGPYKMQLIIICVTIVATSIIGLLPAIISGQIVDKGFPGKTEGNFKLLMLLVGASFSVMLISGLISVLQSYVNTWMSQHLVFDMRNQLFRHLEFMSHRFFTTEKQGDLITRMTSDVSGVERVISGTLIQLFSNIITLITTLFALFSTNAYLSLTGLLLLPVLILPTRLVGRKRFEIATETQAKQDDMNQILNETLNVSGSLLLKLFTREEREYEKFHATNKEIVRLSIRESLVGRWFMMFMRIISDIGPTVIYLVSGLLIFVFGHDITYGQIMIMITLINRLYMPFNSLFSMQVEITRSLALFNRLFGYFDKPHEITNKPNAIAPEKLTGDIEFRDVRFHYNEDSPILKGVNFSIQHGTTTAIVGPSGAGKSTIINLIPRLYDVIGGSVLIDGTDIRDFDMFRLRHNIGYVTQDTYMFNGTVKDNLLYAREDATDEEVIDACKKANIHNFIESLPEKYETIVGNRGLKLSGGEKQRLSIARVILKNPKILLLDEATSSLDSISESMIQEAIDPLLNGRTGVVIAHRLSTIMEADQIVVLRNGVVEGVGNHRELLASNEVYQELYETQFKKAIDDYQSQRDYESQNKAEAETAEQRFPEGFTPPEGGFRPPEGFSFPEGFTPPQGGFRGRGNGGNFPEGFTPPQGGFRGRGSVGGFPEGLTFTPPEGGFRGRRRPSDDSEPPEEPPER